VGVTKVWRFLRQWWWLFLLGALIVAGVLWAILANRGPNGEPPPPLPFLDVAKNEVEKVRLEGEVEKARIAATADAQRSELDRIEAVGENNPVEARRQVADWLAANL